MVWGDTSSNEVMIRNPSNTAWLALADHLGALRYDIAQSLTGDQKQRVQDNIGLGVVAVEDVVPVSKGGTGGTTEAGARAGIQAPWAPINSRVGGRIGTGDFYLPAGGTWLFWRLVTGPSGNVIADTGMGVDAGGTLVASVGGNVYNVWYWRIA